MLPRELDNIAIRISHQKSKLKGADIIIYSLFALVRSFAIVANTGLPFVCYDLRHSIIQTSVGSNQLR